MKGRFFSMPSNLTFEQFKQWMELMRNLSFVEHTGSSMPKELSKDTLVVYRTTSTATPESHVHMPMKAGLLNWDDTEQYMGAILDYAIIPEKKVKLIVDNNDFAEFIPLLGDHS